MNQITEAQVVAFLRERCSEITTATGVEYVYAGVEVYPLGARNLIDTDERWTCYAGTPGGNLKQGKNFAEAFSSLVADCPPFTEAQKRAAIENLLAQAASLQKSAGEIAATLPFIAPNPETSAS